MATETVMRKLFLTKTEAEIWDWAASVCIDYFALDSWDRDDDVAAHEQAVTIAAELAGSKGKTFRVTIVDDRNVAEDMVQRLGTQLPDMTPWEDFTMGDAEWSDAMNGLRAAKTIVKKLRILFNMED